jgi:hypothetical protein
VPEARTTRRERGFAQDFANQLAQMAVGAEAMFVGSALKRERHVGVIEIDAVSGSASVNRHPANLALADYLNEWVLAELNRKKLDRNWLISAVVNIQYSWTADNRERPHWAEFTAVAHVTSTVGETSGTFVNTQPLVLGERSR